MAGKKNNTKKGVTVVLRQKRRMKSTKRPEDKVTALGKALRSLGGLGGQMLGGALGNATVGGAAGTAIGAQLSRWLGQGDYAISKNSIIKPTVPEMHRTGQSVLIRHREYICEVIGSPGFTVQRVLPINPGLEETFPWLSGVAAQFQQYKILGMVYHYVPTSGAISSSQALGSVMLQTTYRATDSAPSSKVEMMNEYWAVEGVPSTDIVHGLECDPKENPFSVHYVRSAGVGATDNLLMYDLGKTFLATQGQATSGVVLGDLWATYEIELIKPVITDSLGLGTRSARFVNNGGSGWIPSTSTFPSPISVPGVNYDAMFTMPRVLGCYLVTVVGVAATATSSWVPSVTGNALTTGITVFNNSWYSAANISSGSNPICVFAFRIVSTSSLATFRVLPSLSMVTGATSLDVFITEVNPAAIGLA